MLNNSPNQFEVYKSIDAYDWYAVEYTFTGKQQLAIENKTHNCTNGFAFNL